MILIARGADGSSASVIIERPRWEDVYSAYPTGFSKNGTISILTGHSLQQFNDEEASVICISIALIKAGMRKALDIADKEIRANNNLKGSKFFVKNARGLKDWLSKKEIWGKADVEIHVKDRDGLAEVQEKILEWSINNETYHGVYIIMGSNSPNHASLWIGHKRDVIDGNNHIKNGSTVYFWGLKRARCDFDEMVGILRAINATNTNQAAIKGFKVINGMSREIPRVEYCATIYRVNGKFRLDGLTTDASINSITPIIDSNVFFENNIAPIRDDAGEIINRDQLNSRIIAYIHTHVVDGVGQNGATFFSARDFHESYQKLVPVYMKHINDSSRILRAEPLLQEPIIEGAINVFRTAHYLTADSSFTARHDGCSNRENCPVPNCPRYHTNDCLFGIFRRHGQRVFRIDPRTEGEVSLW